MPILMVMSKCEPALRLLNLLTKFESTMFVPSAAFIPDEYFKCVWTNNRPLRAIICGPVRVENANDCNSSKLVALVAELSRTKCKREW